MSLRKIKDTTVDTKDDAPCDGRPDYRKVNRGSTTGHGTGFY